MSHTLNAKALTPIEDLPGSLAQRVYHSLREAILSLQFPPGSVLRKGAICEQLGVSRSPVSEAVARLAAEGLVDVVPQSGTRVSRFSLEEIHEAAFMREALETAAAAKVAQEHTPEQLARLARNIRLQQVLLEDGDLPGFYQADEEFHSLLMAVTGFSGLTASVSTISLKLKRLRMLLLPEPGRAADAANEHVAIFKAIRAGDPEGARLSMQFHLRQLISRFDPLEKQYPNLFRPR